ncbi:MAG TPA: hypothetical protein VFL04_06275 [Rectinemataceae bacterium]|nr:hypothetical protein [Rectinemataceae bacterium]
MGAAIIGTGSGVMSKLFDVIAEARWRGELNPGEYRWILDHVCKCWAESRTEEGPPGFAHVEVLLQPKPKADKPHLRRRAGSS